MVAQTTMPMGFALATNLCLPDMLQSKPLKPCSVCKSSFTQYQSFVTWCSPDCGAVVGMKKLDKQKRLAKIKERKETKKALEKFKTPTKWEAECRAIVQKIARIRDRHDGCISCHMGPDYCGAWHGSHYRPAGNNAAVQFHLWNIHKACEQCNLFKSGNLSAYRPRLVEKIGVDRVEWLESQNHPVKTNMTYLRRFKQVMGKRLLRMEKRLKN